MKEVNFSLKILSHSLFIIFCFATINTDANAGSCNAEPTDMSVSYGEQITCEINPGADTDVYRFSGNAKDRVLVEADWASGDNYFMPRVKLYAPDGTALSDKWSPAQIDMVLPQTGTYTVFVSDNGSKYSGSYTFMVSCTGGNCLSSLPPPENTGCNISGNPEPTDIYLNYGTMVHSDIYPGTDTDIYRFWGNNKDRVLVEADWANGDNDFIPRVKLYAPDGTALSDKWSPAQIDMVLPQTGTYTVFVSSNNTKYSGSYTFIVSCGGGSCLPIGNSPCSAPTLSSDFKIHIPVLNYQTQGGTIPCWADFIYQPDSSGNILFKLVDFGLIQ